MLTEKILQVAQMGDEAILWLLLILSVLSIGTIIERWIVIGQVKRKSNKVNARVQMALQSYNIEDVEAMSGDVSSLEGKVLSYALRHLKDSGTKGLEELFNTFVVTERPKLEQNLNFLATVGSTAPYIGLLGTVLGIMRAFNDLALTQDGGQQTVMAGISVALVATAVGLFVAIPAVVSFNHFQKQVKNIFQNLEGIKELCLSYAKKKGL